MLDENGGQDLAVNSQNGRECTYCILTDEALCEGPTNLIKGEREAMVWCRVIMRKKTSYAVPSGTRDVELSHPDTTFQAVMTNFQQSTRQERLLFYPIKNIFS